MLKMLLCIVAALTTASSARAQLHLPKPPVNVKACGGDEDGGYAAALRKLGYKPSVNKGSLDILEKIDAGVCDVGMVQGDALLVYQRRANPGPVKNGVIQVSYREAALLICNEYTKIKTIADVKAGTNVLVGPAEGGPALTWDSLSIIFPNLKTAKLNKLGNPNSDRTLARLRSSTEKVDCVFNVTALGSATIKAFDDAGAKLDLIAIADKRIATLQTSDGRKPYFDATIPAGTYKNLQSAVKGAAVPTVTVDAIVVGNKDWMAKNPDEVKRIVAVKLN